MSTSANIWSGSSEFSIGMTPYGYYDTDPAFVIDSDKVASWCAKRLGYPIVDVELIDLNFYSAFEESVMEYSNYLYSQSTKNYMMDLQGKTVDNSENYSGKYIEPSMRGVFKLSEQYGAAAPHGGGQNWYKGYINLVANQQRYNLIGDGCVSLQSGSMASDMITIKRIYHYSTPASVRSMGGDYGAQLYNSEFGFNSVQYEYLAYPLNYEAQVMQAIELNDMIRKSNYSFRLTGDILQLSPIPKTSGKLYFDYTLNDEDIIIQSSESDTIISDISNIPFKTITYSKINNIGKNWIKNYTLAISKQMLGLIRGKYSSIPIPDAELTLNSDALLSQALDEKDKLIEELKDILKESSPQTQLQRKADEAGFLETQLSGIPSRIYIG